MAGHAFIVQIEYGGGSEVEFTISEDELRNDRDISIRAIALSKDEDPRRALRTAAYERARRILTRNAEEPTSVVDGDSIVIIPTHAIRAVRLRDPEVSAEARPFGFVMERPQSEPGTR